MKLTDKENTFITKREKHVRMWPITGGISLFLIIMLGVWLFFTNPLLANPIVVLSQLEEGSIPESSLMLMAGMLPLMVQMCLGLTCVIILFCFSSMAKEKKLLDTINRISESSDNEP